MDLSISKKLWKISLETNTNKLDRKHSKIVSNAKEDDFEKFISNFRNWSFQSDCGVPFQLNLYSMKSYGFFKYFKYLLLKIKAYILYKTDESDYFFDDISIIKLLNGFDILEKCPVHETPGNNLAYFINNNVSANVRWLRYIYFATIIRNSIENKAINFLDIGSYYGGLQYVLKKIYPNSTHILVDFPHQLSRAAYFLGASFTNARIYSIHDELSLINFFKLKKSNFFDFVLVSTDLFKNFSDLYIAEKYSIDMLTNFYSLGEMGKDSFSGYLSSQIMLNAKMIYFCNRYDSSPFYEPTYQERYSLLDYLLDGYEIVLNRSSGIHNYMMPVRKLFGKVKPRPISAGYFELIQKKC